MEMRKSVVTASHIFFLTIALNSCATLKDDAIKIGDALKLKVDDALKVNKEFGITLFVIEHNMRVIMSLAQKIFCLAHGELIAEGSPEKIKNDKRVIDAYLGAQ